MNYNPHMQRTPLATGAPGSSQDLASLIEQTGHALTAPALAKLLGFSRAAIYEMTANGRIPHIKIGSSIRYDPFAVASWLRGRVVKAV